MNTTAKDAPDKKAEPVRRAPRPRTASKATAAAAPAPGYLRAQQQFEARAQDWLLGRPGRIMVMPEDLRAIVALGVPCPGCGDLVYGLRAGGHTIEWKQKSPGDQPARHWAAGITASCGKKTKKA